MAPFDAGIRMHTPALSPERPDRVYVGWIDGGLVILDIADKAHPKLVAHRSWQSVGNGFAHTLLPIPSRNLLIQTEEATAANCKDWPKRNWVWDISDETHPFRWRRSRHPPISPRCARRAGGSARTTST